MLPSFNVPNLKAFVYSEQKQKYILGPFDPKLSHTIMKSTRKEKGSQGNQVSYLAVVKTF